MSQETRVEVGESEEGSALASAEQHLNDCVSLLRRAGQQQELPRGLLHRAGLWRVKYEVTKDKSQIESAGRDLGEAQRIAERGSMRIWRIEAALERTRLALALGDRGQALEQLNTARELIRQTEKKYEPHVPDWEEWNPPDYVGVFKKGETVGYHRRDREIEAIGEAIKQLRSSS